MTEPTPAAGDELARLYLAGRDAPCPRCRYNRRDSDRAACPECGHALELAPATPESARAARVAAGWLLGTMFAYGAIGTAYVAWLVTMTFSLGGIGSLFQLVSLVMYATGFLVPLAFSVWAFRVTRRRLRAAGPTPADVRRIRTAGIAMLVGLTLTYLTPVIGFLF